MRYSQTKCPGCDRTYYVPYLVCNLCGHKTMSAFDEKQKAKREGLQKTAHLFADVYPTSHVELSHDRL